MKKDHTLDPKSLQRIKYSFLKILTGSDLSSRRLALMKATSVNPGPCVWLTGCGHGDEVGGIVVIQEIFKRLKKNPLLKGSLYAFPLMNPMGFETGSRHIAVSKEDLNRAFPGNPHGSMAERIADKIFTTIMQTKPALVLDLHNDWVMSIPYSVIDVHPGSELVKVYERVKHFALQSGFIVIKEQDLALGAEDLKRTLSGSLLLNGVPALTLELGEAYVVNEKNVEDGVRSIWRILSGLGMIRPLELPLNYQVPDEFRKKILRYSHHPTSSTSGIIRFLAKPGDIVNKGQKIAKVYNVFGKLQETLLAADRAIVLGHSDSSLALPGGPVTAFGILD